MILKLTNGQSTLVDDNVAPEIINKAWCAHYFVKGHNWYADSRSGFLHWHIIGYPLNGSVIDHINGNTLDNRRDNLRIITHRLNKLNTKLYQTEKLPGIYFDKRIKKWIARIRIGKRRDYLGCFKTSLEASNVYLSKVREIENYGADAK